MGQEGFVGASIDGADTQVRPYTSPAWLRLRSASGWMQGARHAVPLRAFFIVFAGIPLRNHFPHIFTYTQKKNVPALPKEGRDVLHIPLKRAANYCLITFTISLSEAVVTRTV